MTTSKPRQRIRLTSPRQPGNPAAQPLRMTPYAWRKLLFLRDLGPTEVGGFGISAPDDLLLVQDITLVRQKCSPVTVKFDDQAVADHFDDYVDLDYAVERFARIWVHTHPGDSASPSCTDEETFARCFGNSDWAIMFILARRGETYARLTLNSGPGGSLLLPVEIDFSRPFQGTEELAWEQEYVTSVSEEIVLPFPEDVAGSRGSRERHDPLTEDWMYDPFYYSERVEVAGERF
jgi:proteasome lid subunit RPN8/RPN11